MSNTNLHIQNSFLGFSNTSFFVVDESVNISTAANSTSFSFTRTSNGQQSNVNIAAAQLANVTINNVSNTYSLNVNVGGQIESLTVPIPVISNTPVPTATVLIGAQTGNVALTPGMTFNKNTLLPTDNPIALNAATQLLTRLFKFQNQWQGGFGVDSDTQWPSQNSAINWTQLDARINLITSTGQSPVITMIGVPTWMRANSADYFSAPNSAFFQTYANFAAQIAQRYPQVQHFMVWSEMKGFFLNGLKRWDYASYTMMYNDIYTALKAVSPSIQVGGPYVNMGNVYGLKSGGSVISGAYGTVKQIALDVITYWLANKAGADFVVIDGSVMGNDNTQVPADWYAANQYFADCNGWLQSQTNLPIWWSEYYANVCLYDSCAPYATLFDHYQQNGLLIRTLCNMMPNVACALKWKPDGQDLTTNANANGPGLPAPYQIPSGPYANMGDQSAVWSDTSVAGGGKNFPFADSLTQFEQYFPLGAPLFAAPVNGNSNVISAFATANSIALINQTPQTQIVQITRGASTQMIPLNSYQVYMNSF